MEAAILDGKPYSAMRVKGLTTQIHRFPSAFPENLRRFITEGIHGEIIDGSLRLMDIPGRGMGYVATRDLREGQDLLFDTAFVITADKISSVASNALEALARGRINPQFFQDSILTLHRACREGNALCSIVATNQFTCSVNAESDTSALFPRAARFNHSCAPNAIIDSRKGMCVVRAKQDIKAGDEVLLSYIPMDLSHTERRERLQSCGFVCTCLRCMALVDPGTMIPCECGLAWSEDCNSCGYVFNKTDADRRFEILEKEHQYTKSADAMASDPGVLAVRLTNCICDLKRQPGAIAESNPKLVHLVNTLSSCYLFSYTRAFGGRRAMEEYKRCRAIAIEGMESMVGKYSIEYMRALYRFVKTAEWSNESERLSWERKLQDTCRILFLTEMPPNMFVKDVQLK